MHVALLEKAPALGAFLCLGVFTLSPLSSGASPLCEPPTHTESVSVQQIYDGDTVRLSDGRRVRLLNIDTPELGRDGRPDQPFARAAKQTLERLIANQPLRLSTEQKKTDHYGRTLGHLYLSDGRNLAEQLLRQGLGFRASVAPNLARTACAVAAERYAQRAATHLWQGSPWRDVRQLQAGEGGFRLLEGRLSLVQQGRRALWLELDNRLAIRIPSAMAKQSSLTGTKWRKGATVRVRGWLIDRKAGGKRLKAGYKRWLVRLGASSMLTLMD